MYLYYFQSYWQKTSKLVENTLPSPYRVKFTSAKHENVKSGNQGCLEFYDINGCNNLRFSSEYIREYQRAVKNGLHKKGFLSLVRIFCCFPPASFGGIFDKQPFQKSVQLC